MKGKFLNKVSRELTGTRESFRKELKRVHRGAGLNFKAIITIRGVELTFYENDMDLFIEKVFKVKNQERIKFRITTRTSYVY